MKAAIELTEIEAVGKTWQTIKKEIEGFLVKRGATINDQYNKTLTDDQFKRLQVEEEFVSKFADFVNDCESFVNVHKNQIKDLEFTIGMLQRGAEEDRKIFKQLSAENERINKVLTDLFERGESKVLIEIFNHV
jgi:hypothetical protein